MTARAAGHSIAGRSSAAMSGSSIERRRSDGWRAGAVAFAAAIAAMQSVACSGDTIAACAGCSSHDGAAGGSADRSPDGEPESGGHAGTGGRDGGAGVGASGAGANADSSRSGGSSGAAGDAGTATGSDAGCDPTKTPSEAPCLVNDEFSVFVAPHGSGDGAMRDPAANVTQGILIAAATKKANVIVCGGTYSETLSITANERGARVFGGFRCPAGFGETPDASSGPVDASAMGWIYDPKSEPTTVHASAPGPALLVTDATGGVVIEDMSFVGSDAGPSVSRFGAVIDASTDVTLRRVSIAAADAAKGFAATNGIAGLDGPMAGSVQDGYADSMNTPFRGGFWPAPSTCGSLGGRGATSGTGSSSDPGQPLVNPATDDNSALSSASSNGNARPGGSGAKGKAGSAGGAATTIGVFSAMGYAPADGGSGEDGTTGQGGGGGAAAAIDGSGHSATGGAGGMGGCGGKFGSGGGGGGASVGLVVWNSAVVLEDVTISAGLGGDGTQGGDGGNGGLGMPGGIGGQATVGGSGGNGGRGGDGGPGGPGAGGSGGPSIAIAFHELAPTERGAVTLEPSRGGALGPGGIAASGATKAPDGSPGKSLARYEQK